MKRFLISLVLIFLSLSGQAQISIIKVGFSKQYQEKIEAYATKFVNRLQEHTSITRATVTFSYGNTPRISISIPYNYQDIEKTTIFGCTNAIHWRDLRYVLSSLYEYRTYLASDGIVYNRDIMNIPIVIDLFRDTRNYISFVTYNTYRQRWPVVQLADYVRVVRDGLTYIVRLMSYGLSQGYLTTAEGEIDDVSGRRNPAYHFYRFFDMTPEELAQERKLEQERAIKAEIARRLAERRKDSIILVYKKRYDGKVFSLRGGAEWNKSSQIDSLEKYVCKNLAEYYISNKPQHDDWVSTTLYLNKVDGKRVSQIVFDSNRESCKEFLQKAKLPELTPLAIRAQGLKQVYIPIATRDSIRLCVTQKQRYIVEIKSLEEKKLVIYKSQDYYTDFEQEKFLEQVKHLGTFNPKRRFYICFPYTIRNNNVILHCGCFIEPIEKSLIKEVIRQDNLIRAKVEEHLL